MGGWGERTIRFSQRLSGLATSEVLAGVQELGYANLGFIWLHIVSKGFKGVLRTEFAQILGEIWGFAWVDLTLFL